MSHHSEQPMPDDFMRRFREAHSEAERMRQDAYREQLGQTGKYPDGQLNERDEGEIQFAIAGDAERNLIHLNFGKPVAYVSLTPDQAVQVAQSLIRQARGISKEPLLVRIY